MKHLFALALSAFISPAVSRANPELPVAPQVAARAVSFQCRDLFPAGKAKAPRTSWKKTFMNEFEANSRQEMDAWKYAREIEALDSLPDLSEKLADIHGLDTAGRNTYEYVKREILRISVVQALHTGGDRNAKLNITKIARSFRELYRERKRQMELREDVVKTYFAARIESRPLLMDLVQKIDENVLQIEKEMGKQVWQYTGVITNLKEEAGLKKRSNLISEGIERTLREDQSDIVLETPQETARAPEEVSEAVMTQVLAKRVLEDLNLIEEGTANERSPTLAEVEALFKSSATMRASKLEYEIKVEHEQSGKEGKASVLSDQAIGNGIFAFFDKLTLGKLKSYWEQAEKDSAKYMNRTAHFTRVLSFISLSYRLPDTPNGNRQLANSLLKMIPTEPGFLKSLATCKEAIDALRRVKSEDVTMLRSTPWGEQLSLHDVIEREERTRDNNLWSVTDSKRSENIRRTKYVLKAGLAVGSLVTAYMTSDYGIVLINGGVERLTDLWRSIPL